MMTEIKKERVNFKLGELSNDELLEIMNLIPLKAYIEKLKSNGPRIQNELIEVAKFRLDKLPKDKLFDSIIKNYRRGKSWVVPYLENLVNVILIERGIVEIIGTYEKDHSIESLYEKLKEKYFENKLGIQPYLILKCVVEPSEKIPENMLKRLSAEEKNTIDEKQPITEVVTDFKDQSEPKAKLGANRELKKLQEENRKLQNEIENMKIEFSKAINKERTEKDKLKVRFIESITNKTLRIMNVAAEDEVDSWIKRNQINDIDQLWKILHEKEGELGKEIKKEEVKTLQNILTLKYIIVTAKEME